MTRMSFGASSADFVTNNRGDTIAGSVGTVWTAQTGGTQITDLLTADGVPVSTVVSSDSPRGMIQFSGPDDGTAVVWVDFGSGRVKVISHDGFAQTNHLPINVRTYGAVGDGVTDDTDAIQDAIDAAEALFSTTLVQTGVAPEVFIPAGSYLLDGVTISQPIALRGAGPVSTGLKLSAGQTTSLITINVSDVTGTSSDSTNRVVISGMQLRGNRTDAVTQNSSHGIYCPASVNAQYFGSVTAQDIIIDGFCGSGIYLGNNRNWAYLSNVISRFNNTNGLHIWSYDHRAVNCDFAANFGYGVRVSSGVGGSFVGCNINNNLYGVRLDPSAGGAFWFSNCSIGANSRDGVNIAGPGAALGTSAVFTGCQFTANALGNSGLYSDFKVVDLGALQIIGCTFTKQNTQVKYLVENSTTAKVQFIGNDIGDFAGLGGAPYSTAKFADVTTVVFAGSDQAWLGPVSGVGTLSGVVSGVEQLRLDGTNVSAFLPVRLMGTTPRLTAYNSAAAADAKNWIFDFQTSGLQVSALNDALGGAVSALRFDRSGTTITRAQFFSPVRLMQYTTVGRPSAVTAGSGGAVYDTTLSKPIFSDGTVWRDAAGTAV